MERSTIFNGKTHYKWPFSIAFCMFTRLGIWTKKIQRSFFDSIHTSWIIPTNVCWTCWDIVPLGMIPGSQGLHGPIVVFIPGHVHLWMVKRLRRLRPAFKHFMPAIPGRSREDQSNIPWLCVKIKSCTIIWVYVICIYISIYICVCVLIGY